MKSTIHKSGLVFRVSGAAFLALILASDLGLAGCSSTGSAERVQVFDLGPLPVPQSDKPLQKKTALVVANIQAASVIDGTGILYRLAWSDAQQLMPYARAKWSMSASQLVQQRMQEALSHNRAVWSLSEGLKLNSSGSVFVLRTDLQEFDQVFDSTDKSRAVVRMRATLSRTSSRGEIFVAQQSFMAEKVCSSSDATGAAHALVLAVDALTSDLDGWIGTVSTSASEQ